MNGNDIKTLIDALSPGGVLTLKPGGIADAPRIDALVTGSFGGTLTATLGAATVGDTSVTYSAAELKSSTFTFYAVDASVPAVLAFTTGADGKFDLAVTATMPAGWTLAASFPAVGALTHNALNGLTFTTATIALASADSPSAAIVTATIDTAKSAIANFAFLLGTSRTVTGAASFVTGGNGAVQPSFSLSSAKIDGPAVSGFELDLFLNLHAAPGKPPMPDGSTPLQGGVNITTALETPPPGLSVPILIAVTGPEQTSYMVSLDTSGEVPAITDLSQLTPYTYGTDPGTLLTAAKTPIGTLSLDYLFATIDTKSWGIWNLQFQISLGTNWTVLDGMFDLEKLSAAVTIPTVFNGGTTPPSGSGFSLMVTADFIVATAPLEVSLSYPALVLTLGLQLGAVIDINDFLHQFAKDVSLPGTASDMSITELTVSADLNNNSYSLSSAANGSLSVITGFILTEIDMAVTYATGAVQSFQFGSHFTIAKAPLFLTASYAKPDWTFEGGSEPGQSINLSDLIVDIAGIFGVTIPGDLPAIVLSKLDMTYATAVGSFTFDAAIAYVNESDPILKKIAGAVSITYSGTPAKAWTGNVQGSIEVGSNLFTVILDFHQSTALAVQWKAEGTETVGIADLCALVGITPPDIPQGFDLNLTEVDGEYDIANQVLALGAVSKSWGLADLVIWNDKVKGWQFYFGLLTSKTISLSDLPLVGSEISKFGSVALDDLMGMAAVPALPAPPPTVVVSAIQKLNQLFSQAYPAPPAGGLPDGVALSMDFDLNGSKTPISIGTGPTPPPPPPSPPPPGAAPPPPPPPSGASQRPTGGSPATSSDGTKWFAVQQSIGPVSIQKIGVRYSDSKLWALMNATISVGGMEIGLLGLGAGSPLDSFDPTFTVSGITVSMQEGDVAFAGALVGSIDPVDLYGEISLEMGPVSLGALAGYATYDGDPSFFLYAVLDAPIGGPSFFFVTGVAAGFGINRQLLVPDVSGVQDFPLVQWAVGINAPSSSPGGDIGTQVLNTMNTLTQSGVIAPKIGEYWFAAGLHFKSFELLDTFALLTVSLGQDFELDILGLSSLSLPPDEPVPIAYAQLAIKASFKPSQGAVSISGQLTNASYVLAKECHLTGGFAFYLWYSGCHAGEFVVTLGGYSPHFTAPPYYPVVPRLGLNWQVSGALSVTGDEYFALTSSAVMAGGGLSAVWQSGGIRAWFDVEADFLLIFQPLHYYVSASIDIGASFSIDLWFTTIRITIHVGVGVEIWGPDFAGEVDVDLDIISFTIGFGSSSRGGNTTVAWSDFATQLLPKPPTTGTDPVKSAPQSAMLAFAEAPETAADPPPPPVLQINSSTGIIQTFDPSTGLDWLVNGQTFQCNVVSAIPLKTYEFLLPQPPDKGNDRPADIILAPPADQPQIKGVPIVPNTAFGVGPVGVDPGDFTSDLTLQITTMEDSEFHAVFQLQNISKAMWEKRDFDSNGVPQNVDPLNDTTIPNVLAGFTLVPFVPPPDHTLPIELVNLQYTVDLNRETLNWSVPGVETRDPFTLDETVQKTIASNRAAANRAALIESINRSGFAVATAVDVSTLADAASTYLLAPSVLRYLGEAR